LTRSRPTVLQDTANTGTADGGEARRGDQTRRNRSTTDEARRRLGEVKLELKMEDGTGSSEGTEESEWELLLGVDRIGME
jgi:hypothetical protein